MIQKFKRWKIATFIYFLIIALIAVIAYIDSVQILAFFEVGSETGWNAYNTYTLPSLIVLWVLIILGPSVVYYFFTRDISESLGILGAGLIMISTGLEDVLYYVFSEQAMGDAMCYFNELHAPVSYYSQMLGEDCVTPFSLITFAMLGLAVSYFVFVTFKEYKPRKVKI